MTREEREKHLDWLYRLKSEIFVFMPKDWVIPFADALDVAIKALEQEPCEDCVSREQALLVLTGENLSSKSAYELIVLFNKRIKELPPVTPQDIDYKAQYESFSKKAEIVISQLRADRDRLKDFLDKIRAEIGKSKTEHEMQLAENDTKGKLLISHIYCDIVHILDKYKAESEG